MKSPMGKLPLSGQFYARLESLTTRHVHPSHHCYRINETEKKNIPHAHSRDGVIGKKKSTHDHNVA